MANVKFLAGDFGEGNGAVILEQVQYPNCGVRPIGVEHIDDFQIVNSDNIANFGWGEHKDLVLQKYEMTTKKTDDIIAAIAFRDGRKALISIPAKVYDKVYSEIKTGLEKTPEGPADNIENDNSAGAFVIAGIFVVFLIIGGAIFSGSPSDISGSSDGEDMDDSDDTPQSEESESADVRHARRFVDDLPSACHESFFVEQDDGSVEIYIRCEQGNDALEGTVVVDDGSVKRVE